MTEFIMLVGVPASGKSTFSARLHENGYVVVSSDSIRKELWGDESVQGNPKEVFEIAHFRILEALQSGKNCVFDATNLKRKNRAVILNKIKQCAPDTQCNCVVFAEPVELLYERNAKRTRKVPEEVIHKMIKGFEMPVEAEGFDSISIKNTTKINLDNIMDVASCFDQNNHYHKYNLYIHCFIATGYLRNNYPNFSIIQRAAMIHDLGKIYTKVETDARGNPTDESHYYGHENYGAYLALMYNYECEEIDRIRIAQMVCYHMQPYFNKTDAARERWKSYLGEHLYNLIEILHEADIHAH